MSCRHGRDPSWCVECRYAGGREGDAVERPVDVVEMMSRRRAGTLVQVTEEDSYDELWA